MRKFLSLVFVLFVSLIAYSQTQTVRGQVRDERGEPVPFATITEAGTRSATSADQNGNFTITIRQGGRLTVTAAGFNSQTVSVTGDNQNITLSRNETLSEVVITGVGAARDKRRVAIDVATLNTRDVAKSATASVEQALQGKIAGAQIQLTTGEPGAQASIILRGINSLGNTRPMFLLDGVQIYDINLLDYSNIERIEVVKGAAAGMLYGAQGANGVIQLFSKRGNRNSSAPSISVNSKVSFDEAISTKNLLANFHHYATDAEGYILNQGGTGRIARNNMGEWTEPQLPAVTGTLVNNKPYRETLYDHMDQAFRRAMTTNNSLNISGGRQGFDYSLNANVLNQQSIIFNDLKRQNLSFNIGIEILRGLTLRGGSQLVFQQEDLLSGDRFSLINSYRWIDFTFQDPNGFYPVRPKNLNEKNILAERQWRDRNSRTQRFIPNINLNYKLNRFVELDYKYGMEIWNNEIRDFYSNQSAYRPTLHQKTYFGPSERGYVYEGYDRSVFRNSLATVLLKTDFEQDFKINVPIKTTTQISYDWRKDEFKSFWGDATEFPSFPPYTIATGAIKNSGGRSSSFVTYGYLLNQSIDFGNVAGISAGFRSDYSSEFGAGGKAFFFPRGTIFFRPSEYLRSSVLSEWKLRAAYGEAGIQPDRFARQATLGTSNIGNATSVYLQSIARNPDLRVQRSKELEIGTDLGITTGLNSWLPRLSLNATYWKRDGIDVIQNANLAASGGFSSIISNLVDLSSRGVELSLDADMYRSNSVTWTSGIRFGKSATKVERVSGGIEVPYGGGAQDDLFTLKEGENIGVFYGQYVLKSLDAVRPNGTPYIATADKNKYEVVNGMVVNKTSKAAFVSAANDKVFLGDPNPKFTMTFLNNLTLFRNLTASFQLDWWHGQEIYNLTRQWLYRDRLSADFDKPITVDGQSGAYVAYYNSLYNSIQPLDWFVEDGSFLRLRDVSLSYNLKSLVNKSWLQGLTLYVTGRNLWTSTNYSGLDPEVARYGNTGTVRGVDYFGFPNLKSYQVGLQVQF